MTVKNPTSCRIAKTVRDIFKYLLKNTITCAKQAYLFTQQPYHLKVVHSAKCTHKSIAFAKQHLIQILVSIISVFNAL